MQEQLENTRVVCLADGNELTISYNEKFYDKVRKYFQLDADVVPSDEHLKEFFIKFMSAAG